MGFREHQRRYDDSRDHICCGTTQTTTLHALAGSPVGPVQRGRRRGAQAQSPRNSTQLSETDGRANLLTSAAWLRIPAPKSVSHRRTRSPDGLWQRPQRRRAMRHATALPAPTGGPSEQMCLQHLWGLGTKASWMRPNNTQCADEARGHDDHTAARAMGNSKSGMANWSGDCCRTHLWCKPRRHRGRSLPSTRGEQKA